MMRQIAFALAVAGWMAAPSSRADFVTYTIRGTITGSLGGTAFTNQSVTITTTGDTANVTGGNGFFQVLASTPTIAVSGFATATLANTNGVYVFDNQGTPAAGMFGTVDTFDILDTIASPFATYNLKTSIGPVSGTPQFNAGHHYATNLGDFVINSASAASFQATVATVPEPSSLGLAGVGVLALLGYARRRRSRG